MIDYFLSKIENTYLDKIPKSKINRIYNHLDTIYSDNEDPWGLNLKKSKTIGLLCLFLVTSDVYWTFVFVYLNN